MKIKEAEARTGITAKNIRFYEDAGLLQPGRKENNYRSYDEDDIQRLLQIKLLRRLGISTREIQLLLAGDLPLQASLELRLNALESEEAALRENRRLCRRLLADGATLDTLQPDTALAEIDRLEQQGFRFANILKDFRNKAAAHMPARWAFCFEPQDPVTNRIEMAAALEHWAEAEGKSLTLHSYSMAPTLTLNGQRYMAVLEMPRPLNLRFPLSIIPDLAGLTGYNLSFGFRWVYLYPIPEAESEAMPR